MKNKSSVNIENEITKFMSKNGQKGGFAKNAKLTPEQRRAHMKMMADKALAKRKLREMETVIEIVDN